MNSKTKLKQYIKFGHGADMLVSMSCLQLGPKWETAESTLTGFSVNQNLPNLQNKV